MTKRSEAIYNAKKAFALKHTRGIWGRLTRVKGHEHIESPKWSYTDDNGYTVILGYHSDYTVIDGAVDSKMTKEAN